MVQQNSKHKRPLLVSLRSFFAGRPASNVEDESTAGLTRMDATRPMAGQREEAQAIKADKKQVVSNKPTVQRAQRVTRREQMFQLVRESMVRSGVLTSGYKFKVLSLDQQGTGFLVMMDLAAEFAGETERLSEIEALIAQTAKHRYNIAVQAVYWRFSEHVVLGRPTARAADVLQHAQAPEVPTATVVKSKAIDISAPVLASAAAVQSTAATKSHYEPLLEDEVLAFKRALDSGEPTVFKKAAAAKASGLLLTGFEETELADENEGMPALSATQYGDLPLA